MYENKFNSIEKLHGDKKSFINFTLDLYKIYYNYPYILIDFSLKYEMNSID